jgi:membrane dipeptidase
VISRRAFLRGGALALGAPFINRGRFCLFAGSAAPVTYSAATIELIQRATVIDMLGLLTLNYRKLSAWESRPGLFLGADFQRIKDSGINVFHPAVGFTEGDVYTSSLNDITGWNAFVAAHPEDFIRVDSPSDLERAKASGRVGIVIGQQNSMHFRTVDDVDSFYRLGQRVSQLTYFPNRIGGGSAGGPDLGLTPFGAEIVERMNNLGMAIDISHCGDRTTLDAIEASKKPVLITHSNCRALVPSSQRCKTDEAIQKTAAKGGVIGVTMVRYFVRSGATATIEDVLDHIDHVVNLAGIEHVGLGSDVDLDGRDSGGHTQRKNDLDGIDYSKKVFDLTEGLLRRNYSPADIELFLGGNFRRALSEIWKA